MPLHAAPILNTGLRTATLGTRFILVFILAKYLDAASVGYYGLFASAVGYALLCLGLDLYTYTSREISKSGPKNSGIFLKSQAIFAIILYTLLSPIIIIAILPYAGLPSFLIWWFLPILIMEHLNQEIYRLLIVLSHQVSASLLLFIRQGSWALAGAALMITHDSARTLSVIMSLWACAGAVAAVAGVWKLYRLKLGGWRGRVDWRWLRKGIVVSGGFLIATMAVRAIQTFDRYWLESLAGINIVGAYVLFFGVASALNVFLDAAIFSFRYPELFKLNNRKQFDSMRNRIKIMAFQAVAVSVAFSVISILLLPILLKWIGQDIYQAEISLYYWILAAMIAYSLSMVPHYALYARGHDRAIIASHIAALMVFIIATLASTYISASYAVPIGVLVAMGTVLIWKTSAYFKVFHRGTDAEAQPVPGVI